MKRNLNNIARLVRALLGLPTAVSCLYVRHFSYGKASLLLALGLFLMGSALIGWSPLYWSLEKRRKNAPLV